MNIIPIITLGAGALLLTAKPKKKTSASTKTRPGQEALPDVDFDDEELAPQPPTEQPGGPGVDDFEEDEPPAGTLPPENEGPVGKPPIGPSGVGSCANEGANKTYARDPEYLAPNLTISQKAITMFSEPQMYFYIRGDLQKKLYNYMLERFAAMKNGQERRTVASVVLREALKHFNPQCKWEVPVDSLGEPERLVWDGGRRLAIMAQVTIGIEDPGFSTLFKTGNRYSITRDSLGDPDPGFMGAQKKNELIGRRVEVLVTDKTQENAEHIIGRIEKLSGPNGEPSLFEVRIVDKFQGIDVAPRLHTKHGFKTGSNAYFSQKGPTGIYRIFQAGVE